MFFKQLLSTMNIRKPKKKSLIKELISNPDNFKFEIHTEDYEIIIRMKYINRNAGLDVDYDKTE